MSVAAAGYGLVRWLDGHAKDAEVRRAVELHTADSRAHHEPPDGTQARATGRTLKRVESELYYLYWVKVGEKAAEVAPQRRRAKAAKVARERFENLVRGGRRYDEAFRLALDVGIP